METALITLQRQLDQDGSALFLLDLTAAFNMDNCSLLAYCLADIRIHGIALQWLRQGERVVLGERLSMGHPLKAILSPMLFNIYTCPFTQLAQNFSLRWIRRVEVLWLGGGGIGLGSWLLILDGMPLKTCTNNQDSGCDSGSLLITLGSDHCIFL